MTVRVLVPPEVDEQVRAIDSWWRAHRPAAPALFVEELAAALSSVAAVPDLGRRYPHPELPGIRRVLLRASRYHVYYVHDADVLFVLAVWSAVRGVGPDLKRLSAGR